MEKLPNHPLLEFHPHTLQNIRKLYNFEDSQRLEEAIDILQEWARKQEHFIVKEFDRDYLERVIITNKGLLERSKKKLDKMCTLRSLLPQFFRPINIVTDLSNLECVSDAILPRLTPDDCRVYMLKNVGNEFNRKFFNDFYIRQVHFWQYISRYDYNAGLFIVYDVIESNLMEVMTSMDLVTLRQIVTILMEGYGVRLKGVYIISDSKVISTIIDLVKPIINKKIKDRLEVLSSRELLKEKIPVDIMPCEYGGKEKSLDELHQNWLKELTSDKEIEQVRKLSEVKTDETMRRVDEFNEEYLGMAGTFRTLNVD